MGGQGGVWPLPAPAEVQPSTAVVQQGLTEGLQRLQNHNFPPPNEEMPFSQAVALVCISSVGPTAGHPLGKGKLFPPLTILLPKAPVSPDTPAHLQSPVGFLRGERPGPGAEVAHQTFTRHRAPVLTLPTATALTRGSPGWLNCS